MAVRAKREYLTSFRRSIEQRIVQPEQVRLNAADLSTIETLVQELAQPDAERVVYAIDVLESLDKRNLVTPLLLYHESPKVRARALQAAGRVAQRDRPARWAPNIRRLLADPRSRPCAPGRSPRSARSATRTPRRSRGRCSPTTIRGSAPPRPRRWRPARGRRRPRPRRSGAGRPHRRHLGRRAAAPGATSPSPIRQTSLPRFRRLLIPLLYDPAPDVADEAMDSVRAAGADDFVFVPTLIALLRHRRLKGQRAAGAGRLRRAGRRRARALPARPRGRHLGPAAHPRDAGADSRTEDRRRADGGARRSRRLPALQGRLGARAAAAERRPADLPARAHREAGARRRTRLLQLPVAALQPVRPEPPAGGIDAGAGARAEALRAPRIGSTGC